MNPSPFGDLLTALRKQRRINQGDLAAKLGTHRNTISKWERGVCLPESKTIVLELARQLGLDSYEMRGLLEASLTTLSPHWQVPYQRNPFFTGRESALHQLHAALSPDRTGLLSQSSALSGLGGIGKTQIAIEYAYRSSNDYSAIFWISAETTASLFASVVAIADVLNLPEKQEQEQEKVVTAVTRWLTTHRDWLLILDNVEDAELMKSIVPAARRGSLLFTSRKQTPRLTTRTMVLKPMTQEEGLCLLLNRARLLEPTVSLDSLAPTQNALAREIVAALGGLPLALDQAGAYIEATQCSLDDYLQLFRTSQVRLLDVSDASMDHPLSVTKTFSLAFQRLEQSHPAAAEVLTVCAFLASDAIPKWLFIEGAAHLGATFEKLAADPFLFHDVIKNLLAYSLVQGDPTTQMITVHRLVQAVLKECLSEALQRAWRTRVIHTVAQLFPSEEMQADYWQRGEHLLSHALLCIRMGEQCREDTEACVPLVTHVATYLVGRARYSEARQLFERALQIEEQTQGGVQILRAEALHGLAELAAVQGNYSEAECLFERVIYIREQTLGAHHPQLAASLGRLGTIYRRQGRYGQAEAVFQQALQILKQAGESDHSLMAYPLNGLGLSYLEQGKYEQAEPLLERALHIREQAFGFQHAEVAPPLNNLGLVYLEQGKYEQAELVLERALHNWEQGLGPEHPNVAYPLGNLGLVYLEQGKYEQAKSAFQQALCIGEQAFGPDYPQLAEPLCGLANIFREQGKYEQANPLYQRALRLLEQAFGLQHPEVAETLHHVARFHQLQQQTEEALSLYQQALAVREQQLGVQHPKTCATRTAYTRLLQERARVEDIAVEETTREGEAARLRGVE